MPDRLVLTIADEGVGFDANLVYGSRGLGSVSIVERVALIGGA
jgi:signal transduction histidine kinase